MYRLYGISIKGLVASFEKIRRALFSSTPEGFMDALKLKGRMTLSPGASTPLSGPSMASQLAFSSMTSRNFSMMAWFSASLT